MSVNCKYCSRRFKTQAALNWHLQKDKDCISKRTKAKPSKVPQRTRSTMQMPPNMQIPPAGPSLQLQLPQLQQQHPQLQSRQSNVILNSVQSQTNIQNSGITKKAAPPIPPKHGRASSKTEVDFDKLLLADLQSESTISNTNQLRDQPSYQSADQPADRPANQLVDPLLIDNLQQQISALKETNSRLLQDKLSHSDELDRLKQKIMSQDAELHKWKDKLLTKKQKMAGEDLKNELITLILESDLNIEAIPDDMEREIYGFIIDNLASKQSMIKKIFCCK